MISYLAGSRLLNRKIPSAPDVVVRVNPLFGFFNSTLTAGTAAPLESTTVPTRLPLVDWANPQMHKSTASENAAIIRVFVITRPFLSLLNPGQYGGFGYAEERGFAGMDGYAVADDDRKC